MVKAALELLAGQLQRWPRNEPLAQEVIAFCNAAGTPGATDELVRAAVESGNEVPELLLRHADKLAGTDPPRALEFYRKAVRGYWPSAEAFIKLGRQYAALGQSPIAESCWRRAFAAANEEQRLEIRRLLGIAINGPGQP